MGLQHGEIDVDQFARPDLLAEGDANDILAECRTASRRGVSRHAAAAALARDDREPAMVATGHADVKACDADPGDVPVQSDRQTAVDIVSLAV